VYGLTVIKGFLLATGMRNAVLITADPYSKIVNSEDKNTALLFGDAATATWVSSEGEWEIGVPTFATDGSGAEHLKISNGFLHMNGRQVFNFAATQVPKQIQSYVDSKDLCLEDIDVYCMHQGSASIVATLARHFPGVRDRFLCDIRMTGNTVSSSIPLLLQSYISNQSCNTILVSGFGVGLSWATTHLKRKKSC